MLKGDRIYVVRWYYNNEYVFASHNFFNSRDDAVKHAKENWDTMFQMAGVNLDKDNFDYAIQCVEIR